MRLPLVFLLLVSAYAYASDVKIAFPANQRHVLPVSQGHALLRQCSRSTPTNSSGFWTPTASDINKLEARLPDALKARKARGDVVPPDDNYHRQYVGIIKGGRRVIYGNFYPPELGYSFNRQSRNSVVICDGGPRFWGVLFDPESESFSDFSFNGVA